MKGPSSLRCGLLVVLAAGLRAQDKPAGDADKSATWLVDAMTETSSSAADGSKTGGAPGEKRSMARDPRAGNKAADGVVNPLSPYLKTWITPGDYELLKAKGSDANPPGITLGTGRDATAAGLPPAMQANPYLADALPHATAKPKPSSTPPAASPPEPASLAVKDDAPPAKPAGPPAEVRKAQDDSKYFPQLKRF